MTAIYYQTSDLKQAAGYRPAWPWVTTLLITIAFFLGTHDLYASQSWQKPAKSDVVKLAAKEANGRASRQIGFLMLGAVGVGLLTRGGGHTFRPLPVLVFPLAMLLLWAVLSVVWSADVQVTLKRQVILACTILAALGLIRAFSIERIIEIGFVHTLLALLVGIAADAVFAPRGTVDEEYRFAGTLHPNHAGMNAAILLLCSLFLAHHHANWKFYLVAAAAAVALALTKSRTAFAATVAGASAFVLLGWPRRKKLLLISVVVVALTVTSGLIAADIVHNASETVLLNRKSSDPTTLTGRTMIWDFALGHVRDDWGRMFAGYGYGGFWTDQTAQALSERAHFTLSEGHNAYLDVLLQLGAVGLFLYLTTIFSVLAFALAWTRRVNPAPAAFAVAILIFTLVHHFAESAMTAPSFPTLMLWVMLGAAALQAPLGAGPEETQR